MKVLLYNWVDFHDPQRLGGGVSHYLKNVTAEAAGDAALELLFLSSGTAYDLKPRGPRWQPMREGPVEDRARRFEIVNSACLAPAHHSFGHPAQIFDPASEAVFLDFLDAQGPFDVVHFHNLEGIPANLLRLRHRFPETRVLLSLHNYYPFCPQVNLWHREAEHCADFDDGRKCADCLTVRTTPRMARMAKSAYTAFRRAGIGPGTAVFDKGVRPAMRLGARAVRGAARMKGGGGPAAGSAETPAPTADHAADTAAAFRDRRAAMVAAINDGCDQVLCVSDRVRQIAEAHGVSPGILRTSYIGSDHAELFGRTAPRPRLLQEDGTLRLAYLGYMRRDKGFYFLLDALAGLDPALAGRLHLVLAAAGSDPAALAAMEALRPRLASLVWHNGYRHDQMDQILDGVGAGIVPVLWEDNLPQVAIEMHSRHIPLVTSDRGGARELGNCPEMVFRAGDARDLARVLATLLGGGIDLDAYWAGAMAPVSMGEHMTALRTAWAG